jgi:hypothetical protein
MVNDARSIKTRSLSAIRLNSGPDFEDLPDGGLMIRSVRMLDTGTWTDSAVQTALYYSPEVLRADSQNWIDNPLWSRHSGGYPRSIIDRIGSVENPTFLDNAIISDLRISGSTQSSRDTIALIKEARSLNKDIWVSVEHGGEERWNESEKRWEASKIVFLGAAIVNRGACKTCVLPRANEEGIDEMTVAELETKVAELEEKIKELTELQTASLDGLKEHSEDAVGALEIKIKELNDVNLEVLEANKALSERVNELEKTPNAPHTRGTPDPERDLEIVDQVKVTASGDVYMRY